MTLTIEVPGVPQSAGSKDAIPLPDGRIIVKDTNPNARPWKDRIIHEARLVLGSMPALGGPIFLAVELRMPRPKSHFNKKGLRPNAPRYHTVRPDATKCVRALEDALTEAGVWRDDAQVAVQKVSKCYAEQPGATIRVSAILEP